MASELKFFRKNIKIQLDEPLTEIEQGQVLLQILSELKFINRQISTVIFIGTVMIILQIAGCGR